jgi:predicted secreted protein
MTHSSHTMKILKERFADERSKKVMFIAHCLINENTRYMGGAFCRGINKEIIDILNHTDCGIVQMICPERLAWGGIYKKSLYQYHGKAKKKFIFNISALFMPLFMFILNRKMKWIAQYTAEEIQDYITNGMEIEGIIGIKGSPACGVTACPDLQEYFKWSSKIDINKVTRKEQNEILKKVTKNGSGEYIKFLKRELEKRKLKVAFYEFDLFDEMDQKPNTALKIAADNMKLNVFREEQEDEYI